MTCRQLWPTCHASGQAAAASRAACRPGLSTKNIRSSSATQHNIFAPTTSQRQQTSRLYLQTMQSTSSQEQQQQLLLAGHQTAAAVAPTVTCLLSPRPSPCSRVKGGTRRLRKTAIPLPLETHRISSRNRISVMDTEKDALAAIGQYQQTDGLGAIRKKKPRQLQSGVLRPAAAGRNRSLVTIMSAITLFRHQWLCRPFTWSRSRSHR